MVKILFEKSLFPMGETSPQKFPRLTETLDGDQVNSKLQSRTRGTQLPSRHIRAVEPPKGVECASLEFNNPGLVAQHRSQCYRAGTVDKKSAFLCVTEEGVVIHKYGCLYTWPADPEDAEKVQLPEGSRLFCKPQTPQSSLQKQVSHEIFRFDDQIEGKIFGVFFETTLEDSVHKQRVHVLTLPSEATQEDIDVFEKLTDSTQAPSDPEDYQEDKWEPLTPIEVLETLTKDERESQGFGPFQSISVANDALGVRFLNHIIRVTRNNHTCKIYLEDLPECEKKEEAEEQGVEEEGAEEEEAEEDVLVGSEAEDDDDNDFVSYLRMKKKKGLYGSLRMTEILDLDFSDAEPDEFGEMQYLTDEELESSSDEEEQEGSDGDE